MNNQLSSPEIHREKENKLLLNKCKLFALCFCVVHQFRTVKTQLIATVSLKPTLCEHNINIKKKVGNAHRNVLKQTH